ncbi:hypothetical protein [Colwellia polaris]|uniref:hypothetical protein n=1 Tax=Colwellia polaris TaxID=326537 RepID=UPI000A175C55|nr:hypothetical protein [Colwellia polaris]
MNLDLQKYNTVEQEIINLYSLFDESPTDEFINLLRVNLIGLHMANDGAIQAVLQFPSDIVLIIECSVFGNIKLTSFHDSLKCTFDGNKENLLISLHFFQLYMNSK